MSAPNQPAEPAAPQTADEIAADIEATRARLADSVDALSDKLDVKAQAKNLVHEASEKVQDTAEEAKERVADAAGAAQQGVGAAADGVVEGSRTLVARFRAASPAVQAAVAAPLLAIITLIIRRSRP